MSVLFSYLLLFSFHTFVTYHHFWLGDIFQLVILNVRTPKLTPKKVYFETPTVVSLNLLLVHMVVRV